MKIMPKLSLSAVILTYNEEKNIQECLESIKGLVQEIFVVDSYSRDKTLEIARKYKSRIYQHVFENQAAQLNWALENLPFETKWIIRLDADERVTPGLRQELLKSLPKVSEKISGLYLKRRVYFMGRWMKHGGYYPIWLLRVWRQGKALAEQKLMDEHMIILEGGTDFLKNDIEEKNQKDLTWWIGKHNNYSSREAQDLLESKKENKIACSLFGRQEQRKRWIKENFYLRLPFFLRSFLYFIYRYFFLLGFLDKKEGLIFHFLQGFWYRFLIDAKLYEAQKEKGWN